MRILLATAAMLAFAGTAEAATLINGNFETGVNPSGSLQLNTGDTTSLPGWRILSAGVDYVDSTVWDASSGSRSIDLSALTRGGIQQRVNDFIVGQTYRLTFDLSANPFDPNARPRDKRINVTASGATPGIFTYALTDANTTTNMLYQTFSYDFKAIAVSQTFSFKSLVQDEYGAVLDNVRLSIVPESATWAMMVVGFGLVGFAARSRRQMKAVAA